MSAALSMSSHWAWVTNTLDKTLSDCENDSLSLWTKCQFNVAPTHIIHTCENNQIIKEHQKHIFLFMYMYNCLNQPAISQTPYLELGT